MFLEKLIKFTCETEPAVLYDTLGLGVYYVFCVFETVVTKEYKETIFLEAFFFK